MKLTSLLFVCLFAGSVASHAGVVFADQFSRYGDGTAVSGHAPAVGSGTWSGGGGWQVNGGALSLVGGSDSVYGYYTSALSAGQKLTITFDTQAVEGFLGNSWAVISLFDSSGGERCYMGDPGGPNTCWGIGGLGNANTTDPNQANTATFTYEYDTGAWTFTTSGGTYSGNGSPGAALNHIRIAGGGDEGGGKIGNMKLSGITVSIQQIVAPELKITAFTRLDSTTYQLVWSGGSGTNDVEASTNLKDWNKILTNVTSPQEITVDTATEPEKFFRVKPASQ